LRKAGAVSVQVLMLTPSAGSKSYEQMFESGMVFQTVAGKVVQPHMYDGNFVVASKSRHPWQKQLNLMAAYAFFYNPLRLLADIARQRGPVGSRPMGMQVLGMLGLLHTIYRTSGWAVRLMFGRVRRCPAPPLPHIAVHLVTGAHEVGRVALPVYH
jgi:hypothetical protein